MKEMIEKYELDNDISVMCVQADSFPQGIQTAFEKLGSAISDTNNRTFFGISHADKNGNIIYKAAAWEKYEGEGESHCLETFRIKKGVYMGELISDFRENISLIGNTFHKLLKDPRLDRDSYCLEWYKDDRDVLCLVKLDDKEQNLNIPNSN
jgi:hypothetical protein